MTTTRLLLFARPPIAGRVKTRLIPSLGRDGALAVYRHCLEHNLELIRNSGLDYQLWLSEPGELPNIPKGSIRIQQGADLGQRMYYALHHALANPRDTHRKAILIGSDCLDLEQSLLLAVDRELDSHDMVLVPAHDGGYVLIAARGAIDDAIFTGIDWGTRHVLQQTLDRASALGISVHTSNPLRDIDRYDDLRHYPELHSYL